MNKHNILCMIFLDNKENIKNFKYFMKKYKYVIVSNKIRDPDFTNQISPSKKLDKKYKIINYSNLVNIRNFDYCVIMNENCKYKTKEAI